ncbi:MAG TPA: homoserine O-succinyltransferase [Steroidobacteraceae bacterium]|nr:homoserine O-succinyltransferase [Steroidobacteraceae bacterium]
MSSLSQAGVARSPTDVHAAGLSTPVVPATPVRQGILQLEQPLSLHHGGRLDGVRVAWRITGNPDGPLVAALGGISAGRTVADVGTSEKGWWCEVIGPGKALDTERYQVLGIDFLGGSGATTGPRAGQTNFPSISSYDQAEILRRVLEHLRTGPLAAVIGASYGGMVALAFAERFPQLVKHAIAISAADRAHPMATAWRSVQRAMVRYAAKSGDAPEGLRLARALAMATYRSPEEFAARFNGAPARIDGRFQFPVESYLLARGDAYAATYVPEAFVCLSESIDLHQVDATRIGVPVTLVAIIEDQLIPVSDMRSLQARLNGATLLELSSLYGHDAFLKEGAALQPVFARALDGQGGAV